MSKKNPYRNKHVIATLEYKPMIGGISTYIQEMERQLKTSKVLFIKKSPSWLEAFKQLLPAKNASCIIVHHVYPLGTAAFLLKLIFRTPYAVVLHGMDYDVAKRTKVRAWLLKHILRSANYVITNSNALSAEVESEMSVHASTVYPVLSKDFIKASGTINCRNLPEKQDDRFNLLTVGRLVDRKNQQAIIEVLPELPENVHYHIVGDGPNRTYLSELARQLKVDHRVHLYGAIEMNQLPKFYRESDVFITLSTKNTEDREGFGIVYLEAQYSCRPVLAYDQPGVREALCKESVIFTRPKNIVKDIRMLMKNPKQRLQMGRKGHEFVQNKFLPDTMAKTLHKLLS